MLLLKYAISGLLCNTSLHICVFLLYEAWLILKCHVVFISKDEWIYTNLLYKCLFWQSLWSSLMASSFFWLNVNWVFYTVERSSIKIIGTMYLRLQSLRPAKVKTNQVFNNGVYIFCAVLHSSNVNAQVVLLWEKMSSLDKDLLYF